MYGYMGKILRVDLTASLVWDEAINESYARAFVGGSALAARYALNLVDEDTDPLGPENPLILMTGPMVGTAMPSAGRYSVCALSPLTGIWGEANSGGFFGPELRFAGYDGILVTGKAKTPVWLSIIEGEAHLHEGSDLWGLDSYATQNAVRALLAQPQARVACIGPAGETGARMAAVMNDHGRAAGRSGMGAVMGAKGLKAIGVRGTAKVPLAYPETLRDVVKEIIDALDEDMAAMSLRLAGTAGYVDMGLMYGDVPIRYFQQGEWEPAAELSGVLMVENFQNRDRACYRCPIACGRETRAPAYGLEKVDGPEYESLIALGSLMLISDQEAIIAAGHLCNVYGLDTISTGVTVALACELSERRLLTADDTGGIEIRYGDAKTLHHLIELMGKGVGFGRVLAEGNRALADRFGVPELNATVNGLELPMHDPRAFSAMAATYALSPRGACHMEGDMYGVDTGQGIAGELGIEPGERFDSSAEKGHITARHQAWRNLYNALTLCQFQNPGVQPLLRALNAITGWELTSEDLLLLGKRGVTLKRMLNLRRGLTPSDERLPKLFTRPLEGGTEGNLPDLNLLLTGAYAEFGWDPETGYPWPETLASLGLSEV